MQVRSSRGVQPHEVAAAADALLAERARPTVERVRAKLGRGSPNAVGPMLEAWFATLAPRLGVGPAAEEYGPPAEIRQAMDVVWTKAQNVAKSEAQQAMAAQREQIESERTALALEREEVARQAQAAAGRESQLHEMLADRSRQLEERTADLAELRAALKQREKALEEARGSIATLVQQKDADTRAHAKTLESLASERERLSERTAARERRLLEDVDRTRQEVKAVGKQLADAQKHFEKERGELERSAQAAAKSAQALEVERAALQARLAAAESRVKELQAQAAKPATKKTLAKRPKARVRPI